MMAQALVAGTLSSQQANIAKIRGLQYSGSARVLHDEEARQARAIYNRRFPVARLSSAPIWQLQLDLLKLTDNSFGFGSKFIWQRSQEPASVL